MRHELPEIDRPTAPKQTDLLRFDGPAYIPERDNKHLTTQYHQIFNLMKDGRYRTLFEIASAINDFHESSISAQLRHMRKTRFGAHIVRREPIKDKKERAARHGKHEYQLSVKGRDEQQ